MSPFSAEEALADLSTASTQLHPDDIVAAVSAAGAGIGLRDLAVYLVDLEQRSLVPMSADSSEDAAPTVLGVDSTVAGRAYRTERPVLVPQNGDGGSARGGTAVWFPLLDSAERLGVVYATVVEVDVDEAQLSRLSAFVGLAAEIVANKMAYGDILTTTRRRRDVSLAAEMCWAMLPPLTFTGRNVTISGIVLPAYEVAGDTFDYAVNGDTAHLAIIDAVGHGLEAARIANLAVSAYRNGRRRGSDIVAAYRAMDAGVAEEFGSEKFATALLATLDLRTGSLRWLNAGHPPPMLIRQGRHVDLASEVWLPVGLGGRDAALAEASLEPGDVVLFFTDGITEARSGRGGEFGRKRLADFVERAMAAAQTPAETLRLLSQAVLSHQEDVLQDDATLLLLRWDGPPGC